MADLRYTVDVNTRDAVRSIDTLKGALVGLATAFSFRELAQFTDSLTSMRNKLQVLTPDLNAVNQQFQALVAIANISRSPLEATVKLFTRLQAAAEDTGISTREAAQVTETLGKVLSMNGITGQEAAGAMLQLSQAISAGRFNGEELNSILENMRPVAKALADAMGVPIGRLKELGSQGAITSDIFFKAMRNIKDSTDDAFARTAPTIGQATTILRNSSLSVLDAFDRTTGASSTVANAIIYIAAQVYKLRENIDSLVSGIKLFLQIVGALAAISIFGRVASAVVNTVKALWAALGELWAAGKVVIDTVRALTASTTILAGRMSFLMDVAKMLVAPLIIIGSVIRDLVVGIAAFLGIGDLIDKLKNFGAANSDAAKEIEDFKKKLEGQKEGLDNTTGANLIAAETTRRLANAYAKLKLELDNQLESQRLGLQQNIQRLRLENNLLETIGLSNSLYEEQSTLQKLALDIDQQRDSALQSISAQVKTLALEFRQLTKVEQEGEKGRGIQQRIRLLNDQALAVEDLFIRYKNGMVKLTEDNLNLKSIEEARKKINEDIIAAIDRQRQQQELAGQAVQDINRQISDLQNKRPEFATLGFTGIQKQLLQIEDDAKRAAQNAAEKFAREFGDVTPLNEAEFAAGLDAIAEGYKQLADLQKEFAQQNYTITRTFSYGWRDAMTRFVEDATNSAQYAKTLFDTFTRGFGDAIVRFVQTGKLSFKDLANSILADVARMASNRLLVSLFGKFFGGGFGTGMGFGNLDFGGFFAHGGRLGAGKWGIAGEAGPELVTGPANITPMTGGGVTNVTYNIQAVDASSFRSLVARDPEFIFNVTEQGRRSLPTRSRR